MRTTLLILCFAVSLIVTAQKDSTWFMKRRAVWNTPPEKLPVQIMPGVIIRAAPLSLLNPYDGPSARLGIEYSIKKDVNLYNEVGYFFRNTGAITKIELKKYISPLKAESCVMSSREYISFEFAFKRQEYRTADSIYVNYGKNYYKEFNVRKSAECFTVKYGTLFVYKSGLTVDLFVGAGIRVRQGCNTLNKEEYIKSSSDYGPNIATNYAGRMVFPNVDFGVKIGFGVK